MTTSEYVHEGICNVCEIVCFWQPCPTGGWWIHDWPTKEIEGHVKGLHEHDADPGWKPVEVDDDNGKAVTTQERE